MASDPYINDENLELAWAARAFEEAEMHYNVITSVDPTHLSLSQQDDAIYEEFRKSFPAFDVNQITEDVLKNPEAKKKWRTFCNKFKEQVQNFNYGALLRLDPLLEYVETNTTFATRIQYLAIEIARNREGVTKRLFDKVMTERRQARTVEKERTDDISTLSRATAEISVSS